MDFYFILCGALAILVGFGCFNFVCKDNKISNIFLTLFLTISAIFSLFDYFNVFGVNVSYNFVLYTLVFIFYFLTLKSARNYIYSSFCALSTIAILMCYYAFLSDTNSLVIDTILLFSIPLGIASNYFCPTQKSNFIGNVIGVIVFEIVYFEISTNSFETLEIGNLTHISYILCSQISYCLFYSLRKCFKKLTENKKQSLKT